MLAAAPGLVNLADPINPTAPATPGRFGWWLAPPGLEGGRQWYDLTGRSHGALSGMSSTSGWRTSTRPGGWSHLQFDGVDDVATLIPGTFPSTPVLAGPGSYTLAFWFRCGTTTANYPGLVSWGVTSSTHGFGVLQIPGASGFLYAVLVDSANTGGVNASLPVLAGLDNRWHRLVATVDRGSGKVSIYLDGVLGAASTIAAGSITTGQGLRAGCRDTYYWGGALDDIALATRAWSAAEVAADYQESRLGYPNSLQRDRRLLFTPITAADGDGLAATLPPAAGIPLPVDLRDPVNRSHPFSAGLAAWWLAVPGLDGGRQWFDLAGQGHGTLANMGSGSGWRGTSRPGGRGHLLLDGVDDYVQFPTVGGAGPFSVGCWFRPAAVGQRHHLLAKYTGTNTLSFDFYITAANKLELGCSQTGAEGNYLAATGATSLVAGRWYRLDATYDGSALRVFVDGLPDGSAAGPASIYSGGQILRAGNLFYNGSNIQQASGAIDGLAYWSRSRSASEVRDYYDDSRAGHPAALGRIRPAAWLAPGVTTVPTWRAYRRRGSILVGTGVY